MQEEAATRVIDDFTAPASMEKFMREKIREGTYEACQRKLVEEYVEPYHRVLEGGAGLGIVTRLLSEKAQIVISCEANPELYACAEHNAPEAIVIHCVLSGQKITAAKESAETGDAFGVGATMGVPIEPNTLISAYRLNALVLDVEGEEAAILKSLKRLEDLELVIVEMHPSLCGTLPLVQAHKRLLEMGFVEAQKIKDGDIFHVAYTKGNSHE